MLTADDLERMTYINTGEIENMVELNKSPYKTCTLNSVTNFIAKMNDLTGFTEMLTADDLERMTYMTTGEIQNMVEHNEFSRKTCNLIYARYFIKM